MKLALALLVLLAPQAPPVPPQPTCNHTAAEYPDAALPPCTGLRDLWCVAMEQTRRKIALALIDNTHCQVAGTIDADYDHDLDDCAHEYWECLQSGGTIPECSTIQSACEAVALSNRDSARATNDAQRAAYKAIVEATFQANVAGCCHHL